MLSPFVFSGQPQVNVVNSLREALKVTSHDTARVNLLRKIARELSGIHPDSALPYNIQAANIAEKIGWKKGIAFTQTDMGLHYASTYNYLKADSFYSRALELYHELGDGYGKAAIFANRSTLYTAKGDYAAALEQAFAALEILENLDDTNTRALVLENVGTIYLRQKRYDKNCNITLSRLNNMKKQTTAKAWRETLPTGELC